MRQQVLLRHLHLVHEDHARGRGAQGELPLDLGRAQALHATLQDEAAHFAVLTLGPHHGDVCHRGVGDPGRKRAKNWVELGVGIACEDK